MSGKAAKMWEQIMALSQEMMGLAEEQQWDAVLEKEAERKTLLECFFSQSIATELAPVVAKAVQSLMAIDQQMMSLFSSKRNEISQKMGGMRKGRQAHTAYTAIAQ